MLCIGFLGVLFQISVFLFFFYKLCIKYLHNKVIHLKKNILYVIFKGIFGYILEHLNLGSCRT